MRGAEEARRNYPTSKALKVCIVGPKCSGKTALARALAGAPWESGRRYTPTVGVRIQELSNNKNTTLELWDCSGDARYEAYHPAVASNAEGLILVYTLSQPKQKLELEKWYHDFAAANHLPASVCQIIGVDTGVNNSKASVKASAMEGRLAAFPHLILVLKNPEANAQLLHVLDGLLQNILKRKRSQE